MTCSYPSPLTCTRVCTRVRAHTHTHLGALKEALAPYSRWDSRKLFWEACGSPELDTEGLNVEAGNSCQRPAFIHSQGLRESGDKDICPVYLCPGLLCGCVLCEKESDHPKERARPTDHRALETGRPCRADSPTYPQSGWNE